MIFFFFFKEFLSLCWARQVASLVCVQVCVWFVAVISIFHLKRELAIEWDRQIDRVRQRYREMAHHQHAKQKPCGDLPAQTLYHRWNTPPSGRHNSDLCVQICMEYGVAASLPSREVGGVAWALFRMICEFLLKSFASRRILGMGTNQLFSSWQSQINKREKFPKTNTKRLTSVRKKRKLSESGR